MKRNLQTILGAGGAIGPELAKSLKEHTQHIRLVSRNPKKVNPTDEVISANLLNAEAVKQAVKGSAVVYLTVGFPYNYEVWKKNWLPVIQNVINACENFNAKLVFFDNIYMYDKNSMANITEESPVNPPSRKGQIRAEIANLILKRVKGGQLTAIIARSADFYGPGIENSILTETVIRPLLQGKKANWIGALDRKHSFTYTPDAAKATALLGNTNDAWNQVWHLPTAANPLTGKQCIEAVAANLGVNAKYRSLPKILIELSGIFIPLMKEMSEMMYQYDRDYIFKSSKFETHFDFHPTPYAEGIKQVVLAEQDKIIIQPT